MKGVKNMKAEIVKIRFNQGYVDKVQNIDWCCEELKKAPMIKPHREYYDKENKKFIPAMMIKDKDNFYKINFCPFCGSPVIVDVVGGRDFSELYDSLVEDYEIIRGKFDDSDSIQERKEFWKQVRTQGGLLDWFYHPMTELGEMEILEKLFYGGLAPILQV